MTTEESDAQAVIANRGVYGISVAADLAGTGVQNLRLYERKGRAPTRQVGGGTRLYSTDDVLRLRRIIDLLAAGLNLAGIAMVLDLQDDNTRMSEQVHPPSGNRRSEPSDDA